MSLWIRFMAMLEAIITWLSVSAACDRERERMVFGNREFTTPRSPLFGCGVCVCVGFTFTNQFNALMAPNLNTAHESAQLAHTHSINHHRLGMCSLRTVPPPPLNTNDLVVRVLAPRHCAAAAAHWLTATCCSRRKRFQC